jgi:hypothetical protein
MTAAVLPADRWELTAPETYLLRYVDCKPRPIEVFTLAVKELVARGAVRQRGLLTADRHRTAEGRRADDDLEAWLTIGRRRFPLSAVDRHDPSRAAAYLVGAGAAVLLIPEAYPSLARLGDRVHAAQPYARRC